MGLWSCRATRSLMSDPILQFQPEREARASDAMPEALKQRRVLSAVYRVSPPTAAGKPLGLALRLMVDPKRLPANVEQERERASA